jgi:diguanylate cyclase (GGDEF)-like protein
MQDPTVEKLRKQSLREKLQHLATKHDTTYKEVFSLYKRKMRETKSFWGRFFPHLPNQLEEQWVLVQYFLIDTIKANLRADKAEREAVLDPLTGLFNRREFDKKINSLLLSGETFWLILFDIDNFKDINDTYGHPIGDKVIKYVARALSAHTRQCDVLARFGGEEFALILKGGSKKNVEDTAERMRLDIEKKLDPKRLLCNEKETPESLTVTVSAGVSQFVESTKNPVEDMIKRADKALYEAKRKGKNRVVVAE